MNREFAQDEMEIKVRALQTRGLCGHRARRRVADSRGPALVAGLSLNK
jgi:hypothetical protein